MKFCLQHQIELGQNGICGPCLEANIARQNANTGSAGADATQVGGSHYKDMAIQPWEVMQAVLTQEEFRGFLKGNVMKYALRSGKKAGATDDADKARHYARKLKEVQGG